MLERWGFALTLRPRPHLETPLPAAIRRVIDGFVEYLRIERRLARSTQTTYRRDVSRFFAAWQAQRYEAHIDLLTPKVVIQYLADCRAQGGSARSTARMLSALRGFARWLALERLRPGRMLGELWTPRIPRSLPHVLSQEDVKRLLRQPSRTHPKGLRDLAMLEVLYSSGLRVAELVALPMSALHLAEGWLKIRGKGGKERQVPIGEPAIAALQVYLGEPRATLLGEGRTSPSVFISTWGRPMTRQAFWKLLKGYAVKVVLTSPASPHTLRHSFATHLLQGGADILSISRMLGHQDISTTEIYTHVAPVHVQEAYQRYHPRA